MITPRLTDNEIRVRVVPTRVRWPEPGTDSIWRELHECVDSLHALARWVDKSCTAAESDETLAVAAVREQRAAVCDKALAKLAQFSQFKTVQKTVRDTIAKSHGDEQRGQGRPLEKALQEIEGGISAARRMLMERCRYVNCPISI
jgi:hypothetical protein